jgi:ankyrin repeat protein
MALLRTLVAAGAAAGRGTAIAALGHKQIAPIAWLLEHGHELTALEAAGLGRNAELARLLEGASPDEASDALAMAVINRQTEAARLCLEAGADPNRFMPANAHSVPLHQAAIHDDVPMLKLLIAHGARRDIADTLWHGTPLGWAVHEKRKEAEAYLRSLG